MHNTLAYNSPHNQILKEFLIKMTFALHLSNLGSPPLRECFLIFTVIFKDEVVRFWNWRIPTRTIGHYYKPWIFVYHRFPAFFKIIWMIFFKSPLKRLYAYLQLFLCFRTSPSSSWSCLYLKNKNSKSLTFLYINWKLFIVKLT